MEKIVKIKNEYNSLDALYNFIKSKTSFKCSKEYDIWEVRTNLSGQMEQCIVLEKSKMHAVKMYFVKENTVKINHIIPNKLMQAYFGKSVKMRQNIFEIITGKIKEVALAPAQKKAFEELEAEIQEIIA